MNNTEAMKKVNELTHEVVSRGICIMDGKLLLCKPVKAKRTYLPGGHIDPGESGAAALMREIGEEMGLESRIERFIGTAEHHFATENGATYELNLVYVVTLSGITAATNP